MSPSLNHQRTLLISTILLFFLLGCSSYQDKAKKMMKAGHYKKAREYWVLSLKKDPDNSEAYKGKKSAEKEIFGQSLISLRGLIIGGQIDDALNKALSIKKRLSQWDFALDTHGSIFYKNEINKLWPFFRSNVLNSLEEKMPLKGYLLFKTHKTLFSFNHSLKLRTLQKKIKISGIERCQEFKKKIKRLPYFGLFTSKFCHFFNPDEKITNIRHSTKDFYGQLNWDLAINGLDLSEKNTLIEILTKTFYKSPFYSPNLNKGLPVKLSGDFKNSLKKTTTQKIHTYEVKIPYTSVEKELRYKKVPYEKEEEVCDSQGCKKQKTIAYKKKTFYEPIIVNKIRKEKRHFNYQANQLEQSLSFSLSGNLFFNHSKEPISFLNKKVKKDFEHSFHLPDIGLSPHKANLLDEKKWFDNTLSELNKKLKKTLKSKWKSLYCKNLDHFSLMEELGNALYKCRKGGSFLNTSFNKWHLNNFGINAKQAKHILWDIK